MIFVMGTAKMAPGELDRLTDAMATQMAATRAEDGCEAYNFSRDVLDPDLLHVAERWRDNDALAAHFKTLHMATFNAVLANAKVLSLSIKAYDGDNVRVLMGQ
jgi:quinol monooxygenase YgiN